MNETYVRLLCPSCQKNWQATPKELPTPDESYSCPDCGETRPLAEIARTDRDLKTLKSFQES